MKPIAYLTSAVCVYLVVAGSCSAQGLSDWLKEKAAKIASAASEQQEAPTITEPFVGEIAGIEDAHDYEGALSESDALCTTVIEPFDLSSNVDSLWQKSLKDGSAMLANFFSGTGDERTAKQQALDKLKLNAKRANWLPMSQEVAYGARLYSARLEHDDNVLPPDGKGRVRRLYSQADELLQSVLSNIEGENPYQFQLLILDNNDVNATALPGGYVFINKGVLDSDEGELVLAHEIGHVLKRHQTRETQARLIDSVQTIDELKSLLAADEKAIDKIIGRSVGFYNAFQNYSRQQELQADACAVQIAGRNPSVDILSMINRYIDSIAATSASQDIAEEDISDELSKALQLVGSGHPDYPERKSRMVEVAGSLQLASVK